MFSIRKINPVVRAVGTMGAVAAVVGGVTFAQISSNTVTLSNNTLSAATASLAIGSTHDCTTGTASAVPGMNFTNLQPGVASAAFPFCIVNTGNAPLNLTAHIPSSFNSGINPNDVSLHFTCGVGGATSGAVDLTTRVGDLAGGQVAFGNGALNNSTNNALSCDVTATINPAAQTTSNQTLAPFNIDFTGTTSDSANPTLLSNSSVTTPVTQGT